jgi:hypothetical protein
MPANPLEFFLLKTRDGQNGLQIAQLTILQRIIDYVYINYGQIVSKSQLTMVYIENVYINVKYYE